MFCTPSTLTVQTKRRSNRDWMWDKLYKIFKKNTLRQQQLLFSISLAHLLLPLYSDRMQSMCCESLARSIRKTRTPFTPTLCQISLNGGRDGESKFSLLQPTPQHRRPRARGFCARAFCKRVMRFPPGKWERKDRREGKRKRGLGMIYMSRISHWALDVANKTCPSLVRMNETTCCYI